MAAHSSLPVTSRHHDRVLDDGLIGEKLGRSYMRCGVGPLPETIQNAIVASAAVSYKARNPDPARSFAAFLSEPFAATAARDGGLDLP